MPNWWFTEETEFDMQGSELKAALIEKLGIRNSHKNVASLFKPKSGPTGASWAYGARWG